MAEIVNLRQARKQREREAKAEAAAEKRLRFGLTRGEKAKTGSERERILASLDGARLERPEADDEPGR